MKREVFEQAAIEANAGTDEIDAEIQQLEARKQALLANREVLQAVGRQMLTVLSIISGTVPATPEAKPVGAPTAAPTAPPVSQYVPYTLREQERPAIAPVPTDDLRRIVSVGS